MKTVYALLAVILVSSAYLLKDTDHGSQKAFSDSIRAAGHFAKVARN